MLPARTKLPRPEFLAGQTSHQDINRFIFVEKTLHYRTSYSIELGSERKETEKEEEKESGYFLQ